MNHDVLQVIDLASEKILLKAAKSDENLLDMECDHDIVEDAMESSMVLTEFGAGTDQEVGYLYMADAALSLAKAVAVRVDSDLEGEE